MINFPPRAVPTSTIHLLSLVINRLNSGTGCGSDDKLCGANVHFFPSFVHRSTQCTCYSLKEIVLFFIFLSPSVFSICSCVCEKLWILKKGQQH